MAERACVVCGSPFAAPPSSKRLTCSPACATARRRQAHAGKRNQWSPEARARLGARGQTANLALGTPAARRSPVAGPYDTNQEAKVWSVVHIESGWHAEVRNLRKWCRDHPHLFAPDPWERAYAGLRQVQAWLMGKRARQVSRWKGWTLSGPAALPDEDA